MVRAEYVASKMQTVKLAATPGQRELLANLAKLGLVSGGAGAAFGVARGLNKMTRPTPQLSLGSGSNVPSQMAIMDPAAIPPVEDEDLEAQPQRPAYKLAGATKSDSWRRLQAGMLPEPDNANVLTGGSMPLTAAAAVLPAVGAYHGIRGLFNKFRQTEQQADLDAAKEEYEAALAKQYHNVAMGKTAEAKAVTDSIDQLFEKSAETWFDKVMSLPPLSTVGLDPKNIYGSAAASGTGGALATMPTKAGTR